VSGAESLSLGDRFDDDTAQHEISNRTALSAEQTATGARRAPVRVGNAAVRAR
jgi:hypothetical protein